MPTLEEMTAWTADEVVEQTKASLPKGVVFAEGIEEGVWCARFSKPNADGEPETLWEDFGVDRRIVLLNAYGWVWLQSAHTPSEASPWVRRREVTPATVTRRAASTAQDPEDLDPTEIDSVYCQAHPRK